MLLLILNMIPEAKPMLSIPGYISSQKTITLVKKKLLSLSTTNSPDHVGRPVYK